MIAALSGRNGMRKCMGKYVVRGNGCFLSSQVSSAKREIEVVQCLRGLTEPATGRTIQSLGILQGIRVSEGSVKVQLDFLIPGYPHRSQVIEQLQAKLKDLPWVADVSFDVESPKKYLNSMSMQDTALSKVGHIIGVSSCKGGVGKSTIAANLAATLSRMGLRVGLLDADVYGPSLPTLLPAVSLDVLRSPSNPKQVVPLRARHCPDLRMLSFGHVNPKSGAPGAGGKAAAVVRGPIASRIINQLLLGTEWGDLDYLIVDMPPGTGDIQITLSQSACLSGAVVVTTPHMLSLVDAAKGVAMFEELKVPTLAVVENMAYFECEHGTRYYPFGRGGRDNLLAGCKALLGGTAAADGGSGGDVLPLPSQDARATDQTAADLPGAGVEHTGSYVRLAHCPLHSLPLVPFDASSGADALLPTAVARPDSDVAAMYEAMAHDVLVEVFKTQLGAFLIPTISIAKGGDELLLRYYGASRTSEYTIPAMELRARDPVTGQVRLEGASTETQAVERYRNVRPEKFDHKGQYGVSVVWSDGHFADIYPYAVLRSIAEEIVSKRKAGV